MNKLNPASSGVWQGKEWTSNEPSQYWEGTEKEEGCSENHRGTVPRYQSYFPKPKCQSSNVTDSLALWTKQEQVFWVAWLAHGVPQVSPLTTCRKTESISRVLNNYLLLTWISFRPISLSSTQGRTARILHARQWKHTLSQLIIACCCSK